MHFVEDVAAPDKFSVDIKLGVRGPVLIELHFFSNDWIVQNVDRLVVG